MRDRAIFVGDPDDVVPHAFGPGLPLIRDWTKQHYDFAGYITGFDPRQLGDRDLLGYRPDERVCIVTVGGSGVGAHLLRRVIAAFPEAKDRVPDLRMIEVACLGDRSRSACRPHDGLEIRPYVPDLYRHLAACDLAVVQGGLTTAMELTANLPGDSFTSRSAHHFEQNYHWEIQALLLPRLPVHGLPHRRTCRHRRGHRHRDRSPRRLPPGRHRRRRPRRIPARRPPVARNTRSGTCRLCDPVTRTASRRCCSTALS